MVGLRFGRLTVVERAGTAKNGEILWQYHCDCGNDGTATGANIRIHMKGCGCVHDEGNHRTHGESGGRSSLYNVWTGMKQRIFYPQHKSSKNYGGRGISLDPQWLQYEPFRDWALSHGYQKGLWLDRINNDGDYSPSNCKFSTPKEQANNRRPYPKHRKSRKRTISTDLI
jgi:hypothetical protein